MKAWITRGSTGALKIHFDKPRMLGKVGITSIMWVSDNCCSIRVIDPFPEVTVENSPQEVEIKLTDL